MANNEIRRDADQVVFDFHCPGCGAEGELGLLISEGMRPFGCPEKCGATFVMWKPGDSLYVLQCVVCPVFEGNVQDAELGADRSIQ